MSKAVYKRFMVFQFQDYEATGGIGDVSVDFDTYEETLKFFKELPKDRLKREYDSTHAFDRIEGRIVLDKRVGNPYKEYK